MKKAILLTYNFYPIEGGIENLMMDFVRAEIEVKWWIVTRKDISNKYLDRKLNIYRIPIRPQFRFKDKIWLKIIQKPVSLPEIINYQTFVYVLRLCKKIQPSFLFCDQYCTALAVKNVANKMNMPWGMWVHGKELLSESKEKQTLLQSANLILSNSNYTKGLAISRGAHPDRIRVINPCVDINKFRPGLNKNLIRQRYGIADSMPVLLTVSHLIKRKGHRLVINAIDRLKREIPDIQYLIVGRGEDEFELKNIVEKHGLNKNVHFCGYISNEELPYYYAASDIYVMPSSDFDDVEGFGITFIEAAASGKPAIGSNTGGISDAIKDGYSGFTINSDDVNELMNKIIILLGKSDLYLQFSKNARKWAERNFSYENFSFNLKQSFKNFNY